MEIKAGDAIYASLQILINIAGYQQAIGEVILDSLYPEEPKRQEIDDQLKKLFAERTELVRVQIQAYFGDSDISSLFEPPKED